jgi:hypothetical protein
MKNIKYKIRIHKYTMFVIRHVLFNKVLYVYCSSGLCKLTPLSNSILYHNKKNAYTLYTFFQKVIQIFSIYIQKINYPNTLLYKSNPYAVFSGIPFKIL